MELNTTYGLSNGNLNLWDKVLRGKRLFDEVIISHLNEHKTFLENLQNDSFCLTNTNELYFEKNPILQNSGKMCCSLKFKEELSHSIIKEVLRNDEISMECDV